MIFVHFESQNHLAGFVGNGVPVHGTLLLGNMRVPGTIIYLHHLGVYPHHRTCISLPMLMGPLLWGVITQHLIFEKITPGCMGCCTIRAGRHSLFTTLRHGCGTCSIMKWDSPGNTLRNGDYNDLYKLINLSYCYTRKHSRLLKSPFAQQKKICTPLSFHFNYYILSGNAG